jgi:RNA polymerase sigma-70 factor (ECF subfamily)
MLRMVGRSDAEELTQDVFLRIFRGLGSFRGDAALGTWVYRLAMNVCLSFLSRRKRRQRLDERFEVAPAETAAPAPDSNPWLRQQLEAAMGQLSPGYRAVLVLHDVEGLNHEEIAKILGCRVGTSKSQLHKARMKMRDLLGPAVLAGEVQP